MQIRRSHILSISLGVLWAAALLPAFVFAEVAVPTLTSPVMDQGQVFSPREASALEAQIRSYLPAVQMQVWTIPSLDGDSIEQVGIRAADKWKLGTAKADNGIIILIAVQDHKMRIEVGQGLEGNVPDALAGRIVDQVLRPAFRRGDFFGGVTSAAQMIDQAAGGQDVAPQLETQRGTRQASSPFRSLLIVVLALFFIVFHIISRITGMRGGGVWRSNSGSWNSGGWSSRGWGGGGRLERWRRRLEWWRRWF